MYAFEKNASENNECVLTIELELVLTRLWRNIAVQNTREGDINDEEITTCAAIFIPE